MDKQIKVLIVDDSSVVRETLKKFFENHDCQTLLAGDGLQCIKISVDEKPDLILLDLFMPVIDGMDALRTLKVLPQTKDIPVVIITAHHEKNLFDEAMKIGAAKVLYKPLISRELFETTNELIKGQPLAQARNRKRELVFDKEIVINPFTEESQKKIKDYLKKYFKDSLNQKKKDITDSINTKNLFLLRSVVSDLKGTGSTIGYKRLTELCTFLERLIADNSTNPQWKDLSYYSKKLLNLLDLIDSGYV